MTTQKDYLGPYNFFNFCRENKLLLISTLVAMGFTYGILLFHTPIGIDTEYAMSLYNNRIARWYSQGGRFGIDLLNLLFFIKEFNPYTCAFFALNFIYLGTIAWCYLISIFSKEKLNAYLIPFALLFITSPVWTEQFYFLMMAAETSLVVLLCPITILFLYRGCLENKTYLIILSVILTVLIISIYQTSIAMLLSGFGICFILFEDSSNYDARYYYILAVKIFFAIIFSGVVYCLIVKILTGQIISSYHKSDYILWTKQNFIDSMYNIVLIAKSIFIDTFIQFVKEKQFKHTYGSALLMPMTLLYIIQICRNTFFFSTQKRAMYIFAGFSIPFCIILIPVLGATVPPIRAMYVLPLVISFLPLYLINKRDKKILKQFLAGIMLIFALYQSQISTQLQYSDWQRYNRDVKIAYDIDRMIQDKINNKKNVRIALVGGYTIDNQFNDNFLQGAVIGSSLFEFADRWVDSWNESTRRVACFMRTLGIKYDIVNDKKKMDEAIIMAQDMPCYPANGCVREYNGIVIINLSVKQSLYCNKVIEEHKKNTISHALKTGEINR
ncbi:MAG: glucosyltransferase domain-containing protein [Endomicrobium sp.]|nr:glucosyltransferase domain-containing protein [Endomicrobium sp.]